MLRKRIVAASCAAAMAVGFAGCADMSKIMTVDGKGINAGVYIDYMLNEYSLQSYYAQYFQSSDTTETEFLKREYSDGKTYSQHFKEYALEQTVRGVAADKLFADEGLKLSDDDKAEIEDNVSSTVDQYGKDYLELQGISEDSVRTVFTYEKQKELLFDHFYDEGGTKAVSDDDIKTYMKDNYLRYKMITISRVPTSTEGDEATDDEKKEAETKAKEQADKYLALAEKTGADSFDDVIEQYEADTEEATEETTQEVTEEATEATSEKEEIDTSAEYTVTFVDSDGKDYTEDSDYPPQTVKGGDKVKKPDTDPTKPYYTFKGWYSDSTSTTEFDFDKPISGDTKIYSGFDTNEVLTQYDKDSASDIQKKIHGLETGKPVLESDDSNYYIIVRLDAGDREDYLSGGSNHKSIIQTMKTEEYNKTLDDLADDMKLDKNESAIDKYTPEKLEEIADKYNQKK